MSSLFSAHAFGLDFASAIPLPEMRAGLTSQGEPVCISIGPAPRPSGLVPVVTDVVAGPQDFWMEVPGLVRLHVADGTRITIDPASGADMADIRAYLLGSGIGALLYQRGRLPLHASAVLIGDVAVAFCGASGAGKSSMADALVRRGHRLLCDDIAAITVGADGPMLWPGLVMLKLWADRIAASGDTSDGLAPVLARMDKYVRPVTTLAPYAAHRLHHVITLAVDDAATPSLRPLTGTSAPALLVANSFRGQLVTPMQRAHAHFGQCTTVASQCQLWTLTRPLDHDAMAAACAAVEAAVRTS